MEHLRRRPNKAMGNFVVFRSGMHWYTRTKSLKKKRLANCPVMFFLYLPTLVEDDEEDS